MDEEDLIELSARLTVHEFLLEILYARGFAAADDPTAALEAFRREFLDRVRHRSWARHPAPDHREDRTVEEIRMKSLTLAERFVEKVAERTNDLSG